MSFAGTGAEYCRISVAFHGLPPTAEAITLERHLAQLGWDRQFVCVNCIVRFIAAEAREPTVRKPP
jgi:hypothetical protein